VLEDRADLGVAFDGDADRCFFLDDTGEFVPGDFATALLSEAVLEKEPAAKIIYDVRASWAVPETIERAGGVPLINRVGHAFIKHRMRNEDAAFAGEVSGHYYFRDFSQADSGVIPFLLMLELVSNKRRPLSELVRPFRERYFLTGELNTPVADVAVKLQELKERFSGEGEVSHLDGISVDADGWHMNVRPSNTEPLLRLNLEARSRELMERKRDDVLAVMRGEAASV
jgi:phosphomannomutase